MLSLGLPWRLRQESNCLQCRRPGFDPWVGKIPWRRKWQLTPVFLPGEFCGQRSLAGYSPQGRRELNTTEQFHWFTGACFQLRTLSGVSGAHPARRLQQRQPCRSGLLVHVRPVTGEDVPGTPQRVQNVKPPFKGFLGSLWPRDHTWRTAMRETQVQS